MSKQARYVTGIGKALLYTRIAVHVMLHYLARPSAFGWNPLVYGRFLCRALRLLLVFRHNKVVRVSGGWKLHLYLPAYPGLPFFRSVESKLLRQPPGPVTVVYSMTKACSYRCEHCYQRLDAGADISEAALLEIARRVREAGTSMFDIEGGEPLLRFDRLLHLVRSLGPGVETWVNTTGAGLEDGMLENLREAGMFGIMVSLHSPNRSIHDALTGIPGSFDAACDVMRKCRDLGMAAVANSVLSEEELRAGHLAQLMDLARDLDCDFVQLIHPKAAGLWLGRKDQMQSDPDLIDEVRRQHLSYNSRHRPDYPSLAAQVFEEAPNVLGCTAGAVDRFYVNAHGEVQPCEFLNISFGNAAQEPFETILARMREAFPEPCSDWLCSTQAAAIAERIAGSGANRTPLPWEFTSKLVASWDRGKPTKVYKALGIYRR